MYGRTVCVSSHQSFSQVEYFQMLSSRHGSNQSMRRSTFNGSSYQRKKANYFLVHTWFIRKFQFRSLFVVMSNRRNRWNLDGGTRGSEHRLQISDLPLNARSATTTHGGQGKRRKGTPQKTASPFAVADLKHLLGMFRFGAMQ